MRVIVVGPDMGRWAPAARLAAVVAGDDADRKRVQSGDLLC